VLGTDWQLCRFYDCPWNVGNGSEASVWPQARDVGSGPTTVLLNVASIFAYGQTTEVGSNEKAANWGIIKYPSGAKQGHFASTAIGGGKAKPEKCEYGLAAAHF